jgi:hypothetical protein
MRNARHLFAAAPAQLILGEDPAVFRDPLRNRLQNGFEARVMLLRGGMDVHSLLHRREKSLSRPELH